MERRLGKNYTLHPCTANQLDTTKHTVSYMNSSQPTPQQCLRRSFELPTSSGASGPGLRAANFDGHTNANTFQPAYSIRGGAGTCKNQRNSMEKLHSPILCDYLNTVAEVKERTKRRRQMVAIMSTYERRTNAAKWRVDRIDLNCVSGDVRSHYGCGMYMRETKYYAIKLNKKEVNKNTINFNFKFIIFQRQSNVHFIES